MNLDQALRYVARPLQRRHNLFQLAGHAFEYAGEVAERNPLWEAD
jgi:hypothetical protein